MRAGNAHELTADESAEVHPGFYLVRLEEMAGIVLVERNHLVEVHSSQLSDTFGCHLLPESSRRQTHRPELVQVLNQECVGTALGVIKGSSRRTPRAGRSGIRVAVHRCSCGYPPPSQGEEPCAKSRKRLLWRLITVIPSTARPNGFGRESTAMTPRSFRPRAGVGRRPSPETVAVRLLEGGEPVV